MNLLTWVVNQSRLSNNVARKSFAKTAPAKDKEIHHYNEMTQAETLIFVDCDGVFNVGIRDTPGQSPILLCDANLARCEKGAATSSPSSNCGSAAHIIACAAAHDIGHGDDGTYSKFATASGSSDICPLFAKRMADIIRHAGPNYVMVLSSSWRKACHQARVIALEAALSKFSGQSIKFGSRTRPGGDEPEKRLEIIGDFVREYSTNRNNPAAPLRVLVLDDFAATHPRSWSFSERIWSKESVEECLRERSAQPNLTYVKLVHTYDEWTTDFGVQVQIGSGLTEAKVCEAECFLLGKPPCSICCSRDILTT